MIRLTPPPAHVPLHPEVASSKDISSQFNTHFPYEKLPPEIKNIIAGYVAENGFTFFRDFSRINLHNYDTYNNAYVYFRDPQIRTKEIKVLTAFEASKAAIEEPSGEIPKSLQRFSSAFEAFHLARTQLQDLDPRTPRNEPALPFTWHFFHPDFENAYFDFISNIDLEDFHVWHTKGDDSDPSNHTVFTDLLDKATLQMEKTYPPEAAKPLRVIPLILEEMQKENSSVPEMSDVALTTFKAGNAHMAKQLIEKSHISYPEIDPWTAFVVDQQEKYLSPQTNGRIMLAASEGHDVLVALLKQDGSPLHEMDDVSYSRIFQGFESGNADFIAHLLQGNSPLLTVNDTAFSRISKAYEDGYQILADHLLQENSHLRDLGNDSYKRVIDASKTGDERFITHILQKNTDLLKIDSDLFDTLVESIKLGDPRLTAHLLQENGDLLEIDAHSLYTLLTAFESGNERLISLAMQSPNRLADLKDDTFEALFAAARADDATLTQRLSENDLLKYLDS